MNGTDPAVADGAGAGDAMAFSCAPGGNAVGGWAGRIEYPDVGRAEVRVEDKSLAGNIAERDTRPSLSQR